MTKAEDLTTTIGAKPIGNGFTRITIAGPPPNLPRADIMSALEEDAWQCNWSAQDAADGVDGDGLPTFHYGGDYGGRQLSAPGEKPILVGDERDVYPATRRSEPVRPPQLYQDDGYETFAEIALRRCRLESLPSSAESTREKAQQSRRPPLVRDRDHGRRRRALGLRVHTLPEAGALLSREPPTARAGHEPAPP